MRSRASYRNIVATGLVIVLLGITAILNQSVMSAAAREPPDPAPQSLEALSAAVAAKVNYQGVLEEGGMAVDGTRDMEFNFHTVSGCGGVAVHNYPVAGVPISGGVFSVDVPLGQTYVDGQALWLQVEVEGLPLGCEEILPVPYALNLRPGANTIGEPTAFDGWVLKGQLSGAYPSASAVLGETATGFGVKGDSDGGIGLFGQTENGYAVYGYDGGSLSARGYAGLFSSANGIGLKATTNSVLHYIHAGVFEANGGYGLYVNSTQNNGIRAVGGDPGDLADVSASSGRTAVVGLSGTGVGVYGSSRESEGVRGRSRNDYGVHGSSTNEPGVRGYSTFDYGGTFYTIDYRGLKASSPSDWYAGYFANRGGSLRPGLYVDGSSLVTGSKAGYVVDIVRNAGPDTLETGDVVIIAGAGDPIIGEIPLMLVAKASTAGTTAVVGIVDQPYAVPEVPTTAGATLSIESLPHPAAETARQALGTGVSEGEYLSVVTLGAFKMIKADASYGAIQPGDLLVSSVTPGHAMRADTPTPGTVVGKALGELAEGTGTIPVLVTLQ